MTQKTQDLSVLSRGSGQSGAALARTPGVPLPRSKWKTRLLLPGVILVATAFVFVYATGAALRPATEVRVVPVLVKATVPSEVTVQAPGWVEADPFPFAVSALADGVVQDVLVLEGEKVNAGQVVARLVRDDAELARRRADAAVQERTAAVQVARARLEAAQRNWDHPIELTRRLATAEAELAETRGELARWPAELAAAQALAVELEAEHDRVAPLAEHGHSAKIEYIRALQQYQAQRAVVEATRIRKEIIEAQMARIEAEVAAARQDLELRIDDTRALAEAKAALVHAEAGLAHAEVVRDEAQLRLNRMEVRSPADGVVMTRLAEPGAKLMLSADAPRSAQVVRLYDPQRLQVRVDVPLVDAAKVGVGQPAEVIVDVLPDRIYRGYVSRVVHEADVQKNTLQVKVAIEDPSPEIKPEMLARARFLTSNRSQDEPALQRVFVREDLLERETDGVARVWVADQARNVAVLRSVVPGRVGSDGWIQVKDGLQPGDRLIADAPGDLRDGKRIRIVGEDS
ncbi:MAG: efflux RND transporter periplasmic adaptor subunit [Phycisphaerales bacterium]|nr:MAG: efflux RND transporter periplasmic adaptor subunit [Phycisphaerales bacterium]